MTILKVADMHCLACVNRISKSLDAAGIKHVVTLSDKTVSVEDDKADQAIAVLDEAGYEAVK
ncbi:MAG TPA: heavy metal-associated domain-containing protein [Clostridia bacterium]|nr:heavy metal-associated domain-containing protein [Clostridia bacterium]